MARRITTIMPIRKNTLVSGTEKFVQKTITKAKRALTSSLIVALDQAQLYTPLHFGVLKNSQFRTAPKITGVKIMASAGYGADYAAVLHERTDWKSRRVGERGKKGGGANMRATPKFLKRGFDETKSLRQQVIAKEMKI